LLDRPLENRHTIFASDEASARATSREDRGDTPAELAALAAARARHAAPGSSGGPSREGGEAMSGGEGEGGEAMGEGEEGPAPPTKKQRKAIERARAAEYSELEQRIARHEKMRRTLERIGREKALLGKGKRQKLKVAEGMPKAFKWKQRRTK
jgi:hypothetical protein